MAKLIFLGTSNALPSEEHENTHMVVMGEQHNVLIDCPNSPFLRFQKAGLDFNLLTDLILTHFHPDHVSGVPQLLMNMWLMGRLQPINVYGLAHTIDRMVVLMGLYNWTEWPGFYPVNFHRLPDQELVPVIDYDDLHISASPMKHFIPSIGLRIKFTSSNKVIVYSSDTGPCDPLIRLAEKADVLVHEAAGAMSGHSSAANAGEAARLANVRSLYLIHYPTGPFASGNPVVEAKEQYEGPVTLAEDYMVLDFN
jgi:ribonuclease Z